MRSVAVAVLLALVSYGGSASTDGSTGSQTWTLEPQQANLYNDGAFKLWFTATSAPGPSDFVIPPGVTLSVVEADGGTLSGDTYTAPSASTTGTFHVQATDGTTTQTCTVVVQSLPPGA